MIRLIDLLNEVGEGTSKPYSWEELSSNVVFKQIGEMTIAVLPNN